MPFSTKPKISADKSIFKSTALLALISVTFVFAGGFVHVRHSFSAGETLSNKTAAARNANVAPTPPESIPPQVSVNRFKYALDETRDMPIASGVDSFIVVSPDIVEVKIKNRYALTLTGKAKGETILIISFGARRQTFIIEVAGRPPMSERAKTLAADQAENVAGKTTGFLESGYTQGFGNGPSVLRNNIDIRSKLSGDRTLRVGGDLFKIVGDGNADQAFVSRQGFGFNRIALGVDTPRRSIDLLDSQVNLSTLSLYNYTMRGFHVSDIPKASVNGKLEKKGFEVFAGFSRPSFALFNGNGGKLAGVIVPVATGDTWQIRSGVIAVSPDKDHRSGDGGVIGEVSGAFTPNKNISADGELAFSRGDLSGRAALDLRFDRFGANAEITRLASSSPLNSIGAQPGGRSSESFSAFWRPTSHFGGSAGYNHTGISRLTNSQRANFDRTAMYATANWRVNSSLGFNFRYLDQKIDTSIAGAASTFKIATRTFTFGNNIRLSRSWSNNFDARVTYSRETRSTEGLEAGVNFSEQIRYNSHGSSVTGFINYNKRTPSLVDLILRNPSLLPVQLRPIFLLDPALFIQIYRDRLNTLLYGIELPQTANLDAGVRFQTSFSRFTVSGETRYSKSEYLAARQNNVYTMLAVNTRLDNANSLQVNAWKGFGSNAQSSITISYRHIFGMEGGRGFGFGDLLGLNRGQVEGRVYYDLNGNGQDDNEPGITGMTIELGKGRTAHTDGDGRYRISAGAGHYDVTLVSDSLGLRLRGSTTTERHIRLMSGKTESASFGLMDSGFISGKIFNETTFTGTLPRLKDIKVSIRSADNSTGGILQERITDGNGAYEFTNLRPGKYTLTMDPYTLPLDVHIPAQTIWDIIVSPLQGTYFDIPVTPQRVPGI